jgi:hypothetical protein
MKNIYILVITVVRSVSPEVIPYETIFSFPEKKIKLSKSQAVRGGLVSPRHRTLSIFDQVMSPGKRNPCATSAQLDSNCAVALNCCTHIPHARRTLIRLPQQSKLQITITALRLYCAALNCCTHIPNAKRKIIITRHAHLRALVTRGEC